MKQVLFLCTGNYYRSRFAEELFNHLAKEQSLSWHATSRALAIERGTENIGPISKLTVEALAARGIQPCGAKRMPVACTQSDLKNAALVVAVKEAEHRRLLTDRFPGWDVRATFWHVHDVADGPPEEAIEYLDFLVRKLVNQLDFA